MKFEIGDIVYVCSSSYKEVPVGAEGRVRDTWLGKYAVVIPGINNPRSAYNCFYFKAGQISKVEGGTEMSEVKMEGNYRIAMVRFLEGTNTDREYEYACYDNSMREDDYCVVMSANHGIGVGKVSSFIVKDDRKITREIICKADFRGYNARCAKRKLRAELEKKMKQRAAELQELSLYKMLAEHDTSMKELLKEYEDVEVL